MLHRVVSCCLCTIILLLETVASNDVTVDFNPSTVIPSAAWPAVDGTPRTVWRLSPGQTTANFRAATIRPYTVNSTDYCLLFVNDELQCN